MHDRDRLKYGAHAIPRSIPQRSTVLRSQHRVHCWPSVLERFYIASMGRFIECATASSPIWTSLESTVLKHTVLLAQEQRPALEAQIATTKKVKARFIKTMHVKCIEIYFLHLFHTVDRSGLYNTVISPRAALSRYRLGTQNMHINRALGDWTRRVADIYLFIYGMGLYSQRLWCGEVYTFVTPPTISVGFCTCTANIIYCILASYIEPWDNQGSQGVYWRAVGVV